MQTLDLTWEGETTRATIVEIQPGDATRYCFAVVETAERHCWAEEDGDIIGVASVGGPSFGGQWLPLARVREWWRETESGSSEESLSHNLIGWIQNEASPHAKANPWTVRAALLAVLVVYGEA
ncbi:MAG: hypothetical protein WC683_04200 [bacterium]